MRKIKLTDEQAQHYNYLNEKKSQSYNRIKSILNRTNKIESEWWLSIRNKHQINNIESHKVELIKDNNKVYLKIDD